MRKTLRTMLWVSMLAAMTPYAVAQTTGTPPSGSVDTETQKLDTAAENHGQTHVATRIASDFTALAGSKDNALALVRALRNGTAVTLTSTTPPPSGTTGGTGTTTSTTFTPPTGKMGWGNVFISLALAQSSLAQAGITKPTAAQLQAALMGGTVTAANGTTTTFKGVLTMRADGMGWGQIAQSLGTKLGPVVSAIKSTQVKVAKLPTTDTASSGTSTSATGKSASVTTAASGPSSSKGLVSAGGVASHASPHGQGIVNAAGGSGTGVTAATSHGHGSGAGVVSASGASASGAVTSAAGSGADNGKGHGKGKGGG